MRIAVVAFGLLAVLYVGYEVIKFSLFLSKSSELISKATPFQKQIGTVSMLVLGDSTAVGVGSPPELSVPGRLAQLLDAAVENHAESGARVGDIENQIEKIQRSSYDIVLIHVGANDVTHLTPVSDVEQSLDIVLENTKALSPRVLLLTAGKIGDAPLFPWFTRSFLNSRTALVRDIFMRLADKHDVVYVDIYSRTSPFEADVFRYYAPDMLHLTGHGYGFWFSIVREYVEKNWPEIVSKN